MQKDFSTNHNSLKLKKLGIDTLQEYVVFLRKDSQVCRSEGFLAQNRVRVALGELSIIASLITMDSQLLAPGEASLSESAWNILHATDGAIISVSHADPADSLSDVRAKIYEEELAAPAYHRIIKDIVAGLYSDVQIASFVTACANNHLNPAEMISLTQAMIDVGERLTWPQSPIVDKHCVGGLPGNRTTMLLVPIVAAAGLVIPKTSSRAITSPAGTADAMETLAPVVFGTKDMRKIVEREGGCIIWGGGICLSPADDLLIRVERALGLDSEGQMVASVLSKKAAAGSTHVVIDIPVGETAKVRSQAAAQSLSRHLQHVGKAIGLAIDVVITDGSQPVGRGIGPALEARDVLKVLQGEKDAPQDLRERALELTGRIFEMAFKLSKTAGKKQAADILNNGSAWKKFQAICEAQGGMKELTVASYRHTIEAAHLGSVSNIDNRRLAKIAALAGAPNSKTAGVDLHTPLGQKVGKGEPLFTLHAESKGELEYALAYLKGHPCAVVVEDH